MKKIALILLSSTLAACSPSGKPDKANLPTVDELALNPERLKELRKQCKLDRPMLGDQLCNRVAEATRKRFYEPEFNT
ncbi:EexN family lipoprotein [Pseudomonas aeruginosa]